MSTIFKKQKGDDCFRKKVFQFTAVDESGKAITGDYRNR